MRRLFICLAFLAPLVGTPSTTRAEGDWEITPESEKAVERGLHWLAQNQGAAGNWQSNDLGLVSLGALAFLSAGHAPDRGPYGDNVRRALDYVISNAKPSGLLNVADEGRDMYNHGLAVFVLTQAYGLSSDHRLSPTLDRGIKLITNIQCEDGGWDYKAKRLQSGHDLSLAVMQAKALRGAMDIGLEISPSTIEPAIEYVRARYKPTGNADGKQYGDDPQSKLPGAFTYNGGGTTTAMAAAGSVCLQEFGKYDDFRIKRSMDSVCEDIKQRMPIQKGNIPFDAYTMYYVAQGLYQIGGPRWREHYPLVRDGIVKSQTESNAPDSDGSWADGRVGGVPGQLFGTSVAVFALSIPNRYLPILQQGDKTPDSEASRKSAKLWDRPTRYASFHPDQSLTHIFRKSFRANRLLETSSN